MSGQTSIEWTDATWNPVTGCTKVSPGCDHCYAETFAERFRGVKGHHFERGFDVVLRPERLDIPLHWRTPKRVFVNSMSDLFHQDVPDEFIAQVFDTMANARRHTFQVLTKRHARMRSFVQRYVTGGFGDPQIPSGVGVLPNVWLGVSVESQQWETIRGCALRETPAAVRFYSAEPLLGPITANLDGIDWVIVGGESGPGARPMHADWARSLRDRCVAAGVPFLFKQWGAWEPTPVVGVGVLDDPRTCYGETVEDHRYPDLTWRRVYRRVGKKRAGRELDGRTWDEYPAGAA